MIREIVDVVVGDAAHAAAVKVLPRESPAMSGADVARKALFPADGAKILTAFDDGEFVGAASYRLTPEGIKRINTGVLRPGIGIGRRLVRAMIMRHPDEDMWCKSVPAAWGFCEKLGMTPGEILPNGWRIYRLPADRAMKLAAS